MYDIRLIVKNADEIVTVCDKYEPYKAGAAQNMVTSIKRREDGTGCCLVIDVTGVITEIGYDCDILQKYPEISSVVDCGGCAIIPGLVDCHCHPIFAGDRCFEFDMKMNGVSYLDIHSKGGGIYHTVEATQKATHEELLTKFKNRIEDMSSCGTTLLECKTGYGLDVDTEVKMLRVIESAKAQTHMDDLVTTFLGAHAVPKGMTSDEGEKSAILAMMRIHDQYPELNIDFVDVFCEKGVYSAEQSERILIAGRDIFKCEISFHGNELSSTGSGDFGSRINARAISHMEHTTEAEMKKMAVAKTSVVICPTTAYLLRLNPPPVRKMIENNVIVATGTDFNPNAYCYAMPMAMNFGVVNLGMTLKEALVSATINSAYALNRSDRYGSIEVGKFGDILVLCCSDWRNLIYRFGDSRSLIKLTIKKGHIIS